MPQEVWFERDAIRGMYVVYATDGESISPVGFLDIPNNVVFVPKKYVRAVRKQAHEEFPGVEFEFRSAKL